jgi:hypothetical protein
MQLGFVLVVDAYYNAAFGRSAAPSKTNTIEPLVGHTVDARGNEFLVSWTCCARSISQSCQVSTRMEEAEADMCFSTMVVSAARNWPKRR